MNIFGVFVPFAWDQALRTVQTVHPEAVLAGGALRDLILGGTVKDLDIFVGPTLTNLDEVLTIRYGWRRIKQCNMSYCATNVPISTVLTYSVPGLEYEVQIIQLTNLDTPHDAIARMDFAACQVGYCSPSHWCYTPDALKDFLNRTITMLEPADTIQEGRSLARAERFADKYADTDVRVIRNSHASRFAIDFIRDTWEGAYLSADGSELVLA